MIQNFGDLDMIEICGSVNSNLDKLIIFVYFLCAVEVVDFCVLPVADLDSSVASFLT